MIVFYGEFSEESKKYLLKDNAFINFVAGIMGFLIFSIITLIIAAIFDFWWLAWFLFLYVFVALITCLSPYINKEKTIQALMPKKISINGKFIYYELSNTTIEKSLKKVRKVIDYGKFYLLKLSFPQIGGYICQKDLLIQGTIEEFETIFEGKIVRKK